MGTGYLIDTSAFGNFLRANLSQEGINLMKEILQNGSHQISVITRIELMSWIPPTLPAKVAVKDFVSSAAIFDLTESIILETIRIRKQKALKLPDAVIAATAIIHNLTLLSTNDSDFLKVPKLKYKSLNT
jgi:predicted nucleic acid-binding protein